MMLVGQFHSHGRADEKRSVRAWDRRKLTSTQQQANTLEPCNAIKGGRPEKLVSRGKQQEKAGVGQAAKLE